MARRVAACLLPALAIGASWLRLEQPRLAGEAVAVSALALAPVVISSGRYRAVAAAVSSLAATWLIFGAQPWELGPFRDERVVSPVAEAVAQGIVDFYGVALPLAPDRNPEMHALVLCAIFGFTLAMSLLVAAGRPLAAAGVTVAAVGWAATLLTGDAVPIGAFALAAALSIPLVLRSRSTRTLAVGAGAAGIVVAASALVAANTSLARGSALDWESWDIRGPARQATAVRFVWEANYRGIRFPREKTVVLRIEGPELPNYWRTTTLDTFSDDHWLEDLFWLGQVDRESRALPLPQLVPRRAGARVNWLEQRVRIEALVDDHIAAAGTPVGLDARRLGTVFLLSGGVLRARDPIREGETYEVWSYAPSPAPRALARAPARYPFAARRFLELDGREFPAFGVPHRGRLVDALFADPSYSAFERYRPLAMVARRVTGRATTPYGAVLALESWLRRTGGFRYDESPPPVKGSPLVTFVTKSKAGYCQHFAGAMAAMLRTLGIPARVAVGFTSGTYAGGSWVVTDHDAHAWVEVWFPGFGWIPFDPTPGRGTLGGTYSFASSSRAAVAALRRGELSRSTRPIRARLPDPADLGPGPSGVEQRAPSLLALALLLAALWIFGVGVAKAFVRRLRYATRDPRRLATASRLELESFLRDQGVSVPPGGALRELQRLLVDELGIDGMAYVATTARARYGPPEDARGSAERARMELAVVLRRARAELSVRARLRGFVSVRSLRGGVRA